MNFISQTQLQMRLYECAMLTKVALQFPTPT